MPINQLGAESEKNYADLESSLLNYGVSELKVGNLAT